MTEGRKPEFHACGRSGCSERAVFEVSVPSYQQWACAGDLNWAVWLMNDSPVQVRLLELGATSGVLTEPERGDAIVNRDQAEAMCRLLIDSGDMTPMARMQLRKLWGEEVSDEA